MTRTMRTLGGPASANLDALAAGARKMWADMFEVHVEHDFAMNSVRISLTHGKNRYTSLIDRMVYGNKAPRTAVLASRPEDLLMSDLEVTEWALGDAVRNLAYQLGPVEHIVERMERAEKELHVANVQREFYQKAEARATATADNYYKLIQEFWSQPWYKRVWQALTQV